MSKKTGPPTFDEILTITLKVMMALKFSPEEQARTLGYLEPVGNNPAYFKKKLKRMPHEALLNRCEIICVIAARIDAVFGEDHDAKLRWLRAQHVAHHGESVKDLMTDGGLSRLETALEIVNEAPLPD